MLSGNALFPRKVGGRNEQNNLQELKIMREKMKI